MKKYKTSKKECENLINKTHVCERCGRGIVAIETVDNSGAPTYWSGCMHGGEWGNLTGGVPQWVRELAIKMVLSGETSYSSIEYKKDANESEKEYWRGKQVSGFCNKIMRMEHLKNGGEPHFRKSKEEFFEKR